MMNRLHLPVRERPAGANVASIADSFVPLKLQARAHSHVCTAFAPGALLASSEGWLPLVKLAPSTAGI